jgi:purine-nucleoside phosphorylase
MNDVISDPYELAHTAADDLRQRGFGDHDVFLVLGSGWVDAAEALGTPAVTARIGEVPGFIAPVAEGHGQDIRSYDVGGVLVLAFTGRTHLYEGHGVEPVVHATRVAAALGCRVAIYTNANGGYHDDWRPGDCMVVRDHLNLTGRSPLRGARFVDLTEAYSARLRAIAHRLHPEFVEGVYAMLPGPHYETPAEGAMLVGFGADAVGMSTVLEVIAARELGMEVLALSMVTVTATPGGAYAGSGGSGGSDHTGIDPSEVVAVAAQSAAALGSTLGQIIEAAGDRP